MKTVTARPKGLSLIVWAAVSAALLLAGCGPKPAPPPGVPQGAKAGDLVGLGPCTYKPHDVEYKAECGTLVVPENRSNPGSRLIAIPLIRVPALSSSHVEPIFFLQGGPGGSNFQFGELGGLIDNRDFVLVGYRGVDGATAMDCPEIADAVRNAEGSVLSDAALDDFADAAGQCATRLQAEGVDLAGYTMTEVVDDLEAARVALGYDRVNLLGESYGTRLEMLYEWMYPERLSRVVMVAVNPPGHFLWEPQNIDAQLADYAALCAKDAQCSARTDDLLASMRHVSENMPKRWLFFPIDPAGVKMLTFFMLMESIQPPGAPVPISGPAAIDVWLAAEKGDASGMALMTLTRNMFLPNMFVFGDLLAKGGSGGDFEGRSGDSPATLMPPGSIIGSPLTLWHWGMFRKWPIYLVPDEYRHVQSTDVETLLVSGSIDFSTPPQFATNELLPYLKNGEQVILKDFGHTETFWYSQPEARQHLLNTFYDTGKVDASIYQYQPVDFRVQSGWPAMAKFMLAIVVVILVILVLLVWLIVRSIRRRRTRQP